MKNLINIVVFCDAISVTSTRMGIFFGVIFLFYSPNTHRAFSLVLLFFFLLQPTELKHVSRLEKGKKASQRIMKNTYLILRSNCNVFDSTICSYDSKSGYESHRWGFFGSYQYQSFQMRNSKYQLHIYTHAQRETA